MSESKEYINDFLAKLNKEQKLDERQLLHYGELSLNLHKVISNRAKIINKLRELLDE